jgi:hypothetical protein
MSARLLLTICHLHKFNSQSIDFVLAFPQADLDIDIYMELPEGIEIDGGKESHVLKLNKNLYGLKQASHNWFVMLSNGLKDRGFTPSDMDPCVFYKEDMIVLVYVDDMIAVARDDKQIDDLIESLREGNEHFKLTSEGKLDEYLGMEIVDSEGGAFEIKQPHLIERILKAVGINPADTNSRDTPATLPLLHKDLEGIERKLQWNYRSIIGMMNYLSGSTRPDISMAVHQAARFSNCPMLTHEKGVMRISRYLIATRDRGIVFRPDMMKGLELYVDADFAGNWKKADKDSPENCLSRTGYIFKYNNCPIVWKSQLQTEICLSSAEAEYVAMSQALRQTLPLIHILKEFNCVFPEVAYSTPTFNCKVFEDNTACISIADSDKFTPRTKHIALKYHWFKEYAKRKVFDIMYISTTEQLADYFTKPLERVAFLKFRKLVNGY